MHRKKKVLDSINSSSQWSCVLNQSKLTEVSEILAILIRPQVTPRLRDSAPFASEESE